MQEESLWHDKFSQTVFLKHFKQNSSRHFSVKQNIRLHTRYKKHMYRDRKRTTHVEIGEEDIHHIYIYIYIKDKHNVCKNGHKTGVQE